MSNNHHPIISKSYLLKKLSCLYICLSFLLLSIPDKSFAGEITIDLGTDYGYYTYPPICTYFYYYTYSQQIYLQSELNPGQAITIDSIGFDYQGQSWSQNLVVYMGNTSQSTFSTSTSWVSTSNMTQVFSGSYSVGTNGWYKIGLSTPFTYNNVANLVIAVHENSSYYPTATTNYFWNNECSPSLRSLTVYRDAVISPSSPPSGYQDTKRPKLWLHYTLSLPIAGSGDCLNFSGNDYVYVNSSGTAAATSWTLEFWIKPNSALDNDRIVIQGATANATRQIMAVWDNGDDQIEFVETSGGSGTPDIVSSTITDNNSTWTHVAWTYNGSTHNVYVNGQSSTGSSSGTTYGTEGNFYIGCRTGSQNYFHGCIDEVRLWSGEARTQSEIQDNMYKALEGDETNFTLYFQFDEGTGAATADNTSTPQNGTITGASYWVASEAWKSRTTGDDTPLTFCAGYHPSDNAMTISETVSPSNGSLVFDHTNVEITYIPDFESSGADNFTFQLSDGTNTDTYAMTVTTTNVNASPVAGSGNCLEFDGSNDYVYISDGSIVTDNTFTLEFWIKPNSTGDGERIFIQGESASASRQIMAVWDADDDQIEFVTTEDTPGSPNKASSTITDDNSTWTHVAWTCNSGSYTVYVNGQSTSGSTSGSSYGTNGDTYIGCRNGSGNYFSGCIDEVRLWDDVRTQSEIEDNMYTALLGTETDLVGYWRFDESSGTILRDFSGDDHHGLLTNMTDGDWVASDAWKYRSMLINSSLSHSAGYDPDGDGLTLSEVGGPTTGLSFDDANRECDYSSGGSSGTINYTYQVSDAKDKTRLTDSYAMEIEVSGEEDYNDWNYSRNIIIDTDPLDLSGNVTNFPLLVRLDNDKVPFAQCLSTGYDIRFSTSGGTHLSYERERWDNSGQVAEFWVLVPTVYNENSTQYIKIYWGKSDAADVSASEDVFTTSNNFVATYHLEEVANTDVDGYEDASGNNYHGQGAGPTVDVDGVIGRAQHFGGGPSSDCIELPESNNFLSAQITISAWIKADSINATDGYTRIFTTHAGATSGSALTLTLGSSDNVQFYKSTATSGYYNWATTVSTATEYYVTLTFDGADFNTYRNGAIDGSAVTSTIPSGGTYPAFIGAFYQAEREFAGIIDEVRISDDDRSADWIELCYETQKTGQTVVIWPTQSEDYTDWTYNTDFYINTTSSGAGVDNDVLDFPLLVRLDNTILTFSQAESDGTDIRFAKSDGTHLYYERERWDNSGEEAEFWVKIDTAYGNNATQYFRMYWGNSECEDSSNAEAVFATADDFEGVWHLNEDPTGGSGCIVDRTANSNDGTPGNMAADDDVDANIGIGLDFDGSDDYVNAGSGTSLDDVDPVTLSAWIYPHGWGSGTYGRIVDKNNMLFFLANQGSSNGLETFAFQFNRATANTNVRAANYSLDLNEWVYVTAVMNGTSSTKLYLDGVEVSSYVTQSLGSGAHTSDAASDLYIGNRSAGDRDFDGLIDELRFCSAVRSDDWIKLCYETQKQGQNTVISEKVELLPLTITYDIGTGTSDTVAISTDEWKIVFDENIGGGIKWLSYEGGSRRGGDNQLDPTTNLFYVRANQSEAYNQNGQLNVLDSNSLFCRVRQSVTCASVPFLIDYTVYGNARMFIRVEIDARHAGYTLDNGGLQFRVESDVSNKEYYSEGVDADTSNYILHSDRGSGKYDILLALYEDWGDATSFTLATGDYYGYKCDPYTISAGNKEAWEILVDFGHRKWNDTSGVGSHVDDYRNPDSLELYKGTYRMERAWEHGLTGHWPLDDGSGSTAADAAEASNDHDGTVTNATWDNSDAVWNGSLNFETDGGNDYVTVSSNAADFSAWEFTIMMWLKPQTALSSSSDLFSKYTGGDGYVLEGDAGKLALTLDGATVSGNTSLGTGTWKHVAVTYHIHSAEMIFYIDGMVDKIHVHQYPLTTNAANVVIGNGYDGKMDDVRFYKSVISEETIRAVSQNGYRVNEGLYMLRASNANTSEIKIDGTGTCPVRFPIFQIANYWATAVPEAVYYNNTRQYSTDDYIATLNDAQNVLTLGFNKAVSSSGLRIYIDDNDSSGVYMTGPMPTMTYGASGSDYYVQNFTGDWFGPTGSNEFYLYWKMSNTGTTGMGGELTQWKSSEISPSDSVTDATTTNMLPTDTTYGTFGFHQPSPGSGQASSAAFVSATPTYTVLEASDVRVRLQIDERTVDAATLDYDITTIWTIYPTGQIFRYDTIDAMSTTFSYEFMRWRTDYEAVSRDSSFSEYRCVIYGGSSVHDHVLALVGSANSSGSTQLFTGRHNIQFQDDGSNYIGWKFDGTDDRLAANAPYKYAFYLDIQNNDMGTTYMNNVCDGVQDIDYSSGDFETNGGTLVDTTEGDLDGDGFNEGEGAYVMRANDNSVNFLMETTNGNRYYPALRILGYSAVKKPKYVRLYNASDTILLIEDYGYNCYLKDAVDELIVQLDTVFTGDTKIYISADDDLAVTLSDFYAKAGDGNDTLFWNTASEEDNLGFYLYRRISPQFLDSLGGVIDSVPDSLLDNAGIMLKQGKIGYGDTAWVSLTKEIIPSQYKPGDVPGIPREYMKIDWDVENDILYEYMLAAIDKNRNREDFGPIHVIPQIILPKKFFLFHNFPNPARFYTNFRFDLPVKSKVSLYIYNLQGRLIARILTPDRYMKPGFYRLRWNCRDQQGRKIASGPYIYRFEAKGANKKKYAKNRMMILIK